MSRSIALAAVTTASLATSATWVAQHSIPWNMPEPYRAVQQVTLQTQRAMLLAMIDSMPTQHLRDAVTEGQRDFAQQIHHVAFANTLAIARTFHLAPPDLPDTSIALNSKEGLRALVQRAFDWNGRNPRRPK